MRFETKLESLNDHEQDNNVEGSIPNQWNFIM